MAEFDGNVFIIRTVDCGLMPLIWVLVLTVLVLTLLYCIVLYCIALVLCIVVFKDDDQSSSV